MNNVQFSLAFASLVGALAVRALAQGPGAPAGSAIPAADLPYTNNLVLNPGFERGFERDAKKGWEVFVANGMEAKCETAAPNRPDQPFEGRKALHMFVKNTVKYSNKELNGYWETFERAGNDGKGPPKATVRQYVAVRPGATYALRFRWRSSGLYANALPGPDRGLVELRIRAVWCDENCRGITSDPLAQFCPAENVKVDSEEWATYAWPNLSGTKNPHETPKPKRLFTAPAQAAYMRIDLQFVCMRAKVKPHVWIDQVELAEQPPKPAPKPAAPARQGN